jgi:hypothetical protein
MGQMGQNTVVPSWGGWKEVKLYGCGKNQKHSATSHMVFFEKSFPMLEVQLATIE